MTSNLAIETGVPMWKMASVRMKALQEPADLDTELFQMRLRLALRDTVAQEDELFKRIGGAGIIYFVSSKHKNWVYVYDVYKWLDKSNRSLTSFIKEMNAIIERYFKDILEFSHTDYVKYAPLVNYSRDTYDVSTVNIHSNGRPSEVFISNLGFKMLFDPNMSLALYQMGYVWNYGENDWWRDAPIAKYNDKTYQLDHFSRNWDEVNRHAKYPVHKPINRNWLWDLMFSYDIIVGNNTTSNQLAYRKNKKLNREEQVIAHFKENLLSDLKTDHQGRPLITEVLKCEYKSNQHDPSIRQMVLQLRIKGGWFRMSLTFTPLLIQLFNWNSRHLESGNTWTKDHDGEQFLFDPTSLHPPSYDFLNERSLLYPENNGYQFKRVKEVIPGSSQPVVIVNEPKVDNSKAKVIGFYHLSNTLEKVYRMLPREHFCRQLMTASVDPNNQIECGHTELIFDLDRNIDYPRSYDLQTLSVVISGRIFNSDGTSLKRDAPITLTGSLYKSLIANVQLSINTPKTSFIIDSSNGHFPIRNLILEQFNEPKYYEQTDKLNQTASDISGSKVFSVRIYPFKYYNVPAFHIFEEHSLELRINLNEPNHYIQNTKDIDAKYHLIPFRERCFVEFEDSAVLSPEIESALEYTRIRHLAIYEYRQYNIDKVVIPKELMYFKSDKITTRTKANYWYLCMKRKSNSLNIDAIKFELFDTVRVVIKEGELIVAEKLISLADELSKEEMYQEFKNGRAHNCPIISKETFFNSKMILFLSRMVGRSQGEGDIKVELTFSKPHSFDIELYLISSTYEFINLNYKGEVVKHMRAENEHFKPYITEDSGYFDYKPPPKAIKETRSVYGNYNETLRMTDKSFQSVQLRKRRLDSLIASV